MADRLVAVNDADYRLPPPVIQALATDLGDSGTGLGAAVEEAVGPAAATAMGESGSALAVATDARIGPVVQGVAGRKYKTILGAIRNAGSPGYFQPIIDSAHRPTFIQSVETMSDRIRINYDSAATRVGAIAVVPDETLIAAGFTCGGSVGLNYVDVLVFRTMEFADYVSYNGTSWVSASSIFTPSFASGVLTLTHSSLISTAAAFSGSATARSGPYVAQLDGLGVNSVTVVFRDFAGTQIMTPDTNMRVYVRHGGARPVQWNPTIIDTTTFPNSNFWIVGTQEV